MSDKKLKDIRWPSAIGVFGLGAIVGSIICFFQVAKVTLASGQSTEINMEYHDLAAILLTSVAVIVTVFGVIVGILAVFGFKDIKKSAIDSAKVAAIEEVKRQISEDGDHENVGDGELRDFIEASLKKAATELVLKLNGRDQDFGNEDDEYGDG